jgi:hypothetical protein
MIVTVIYNCYFSTKYGVYKTNCGLENVMMSWGHDEYMYQVLKHNKTTLPEEALYMIRYALGSDCDMSLNLLFLCSTIQFLDIVHCLVFKIQEFNLVFQRQAVFPKCCASAQRLNEAMSVRTS